MNQLERLHQLAEYFYKLPDRPNSNLVEGYNLFSNSAWQYLSEFVTTKVIDIRLHFTPTIREGEQNKLPRDRSDTTDFQVFDTLTQKLGQKPVELSSSPSLVGPLLIVGDHFHFAAKSGQAGDKLSLVWPISRADAPRPRILGIFFVRSQSN